MDTAIKTTIAALVGLLALSGVAAAQGCPECDEDGPGNAQNSYHDADVGVILNETRALADTDVAYVEKQDDGGFFVWLSLCLEVFVEKIEGILGLQTGVNANAEVYASEDGVDVDATARSLGEVVDFDDSAVGHLDGETWKAMAGTSATVRSVNSQVPALPHVPDTQVDVCVDLEVVAHVACD